MGFSLLGKGVVVCRVMLVYRDVRRLEGTLKILVFEVPLGNGTGPTQGRRNEDLAR